MMIEKYDCKFFVDEKSENVGFWTHHFNNGWENDTISFVKKHIDVNKTFIDIGAWIGPISLISCFNSKQCICFEPDPYAYEEFNNTILLNNIENIILENKAVSIHNEICLGSEKLGNSITRDSCRDNQYKIKCISISEIFDKYNLTKNNVSLIKIDIEGHESELLKDKFLVNLDIPMHVSFHPGYKENKEEFISNVSEFLKKRNYDVNKFPSQDFFSIEFI